MTVTLQANGSPARGHREAPPPDESLRIELVVGRHRLRDHREDTGLGYRDFVRSVRDDLTPMLMPYSRHPAQGDWEWRFHRLGRKECYFFLRVAGLAPIRVAFVRDAARWARLSLHPELRGMIWEVVTDPLAVLDPNHAPGTGYLESDRARALALAEEKHEEFLSREVPTVPARATPPQQFLAAFEALVHHYAERMVHEAPQKAG